MSGLSGLALIVDDEKDLCTVLQVILKSMGLSVDISSNGHDAIEMVQRKKYDYLLTDLNMEHMTGMQLAIRIRAISPLTRIIAMTGDIESDSNVDSAVFDGWISKPFSTDSLMTALSLLKQ